MVFSCLTDYWRRYAWQAAAVMPHAKSGKKTANICRRMLDLFLSA
jgi:hypothetical protein